MALKTQLDYSPNFNPVKRNKKQIKFIVFHYTGMKKESDAINKLTNIQGYYPAPGSSESFFSLFLGEVDAPDKETIRGLENENEDILVKSYSFMDVKNKMENKEILNGLTLIALQWFFLNIYKI